MSDDDTVTENRKWAATVIDLYDSLKGALPEQLACDIVFEWAVYCIRGFEDADD